MNDDSNKKNKFAHLLFENKRIVLTVELALFVIALFISIIGRVYEWNSIFVGIINNVFTACLITIVVSLINWNVHSEYEATLNAVKNESQDRIKDVEKLVEAYKETITTTCKKCETTFEKVKDDSQKSCMKTEEITTKLESILSSYFNRNCLFCKIYLIDVYPNREKCNLKSFFNKAEREICILTTNLESIKDSSSVLIKKAKNGVEVKLCTIDPRAAKTFNITRVTGEDRSSRTRFDSMWNSLHYFIEKNETIFSDSINNKHCELHNKQNSLKIKTYSIMPTIILFISDDECIVSFMLNKHFARDVIHLHFDTSLTYLQTGGLQEITPKIFKDHFDNVFENAADVCEEAVNNWEYVEA
jgi:sugar-specific transcriptional regulator TrmB